MMKAITSSTMATSYKPEGVLGRAPVVRCLFCRSYSISRPAGWELAVINMFVLGDLVPEPSSLFLSQGCFGGLGTHTTILSHYHYTNLLPQRLGDL